MEPVSEGTVDWTKGEIRVSGSGLPRRISPFVDVIEGDLARGATGEARTKLGLVSRALPLDGDRTVAALLQADPAAAGRLDEAIGGMRTAAPLTLSDGAVVVRATLPLDEVVTALGLVAWPLAAGETVLDARGTGLRPALAPRVGGPSGDPLPVGRVRYATRPPRGRRELVRVREAAGARACDVVLSAEDVVRLRASLDGAAARLLVVVDRGEAE